MIALDRRGGGGGGVNEYEQNEQNRSRIEVLLFMNAWFTLFD